MLKTEMQRMAEDWNARAKDDARYFVAFEKKGQGDEFWKGGTDVAAFVESNFRRWTSSDRPTAHPSRTLDIGCGPGRLMAHLAPYFDEVHGVDVSSEMIRQAESFHVDPKLHFHVLPGTPRFEFPDEHFDCVYSFAVFQHIPYRSIIDAYFVESHRVLKPGGVLAVQVRMTPHPEAALGVGSWEGVVLERSDIIAMANDLGFRLGSVDGESEQYIWVIGVKSSVALDLGENPTLLRVAPSAPDALGLAAWGPGAVGSIFLSRIQREQCALNNVTLTIDGLHADVVDFGPTVENGVAQIDFLVPSSIGPGEKTLRIQFDAETRPWEQESAVTILPPPPEKIDWLWISDGSEVMRRGQVLVGTAKIQVRGIRATDGVQLEIEGLEPIPFNDPVVINERLGWFEMNFPVPAVVTGEYRVRISRPDLGATELREAWSLFREPRTRDALAVSGRG